MSGNLDLLPMYAYSTLGARVIQELMLFHIFFIFVYEIFGFSYYIYIYESSILPGMGWLSLFNFELLSKWWESCIHQNTLSSG